MDSYGSPSGNPLGGYNPNINPRLPNKRVYQTAESKPEPAFLKTDGSSAPPEVQAEPDKIVLSEPGYGDFNKRTGEAATLSLGGKPRSLELEHEEHDHNSKSALKNVNTVDSSTVRFHWNF